MRTASPTISKNLFADILRLTAELGQQGKAFSVTRIILAGASIWRISVPLVCCNSASRQARGGGAQR